MALLARDNGGPPLVFQLLWYPSITADLSLPSFTENADAPMLNRDVIEAFVAWYVPGMDISDPKALPVTLSPANAADLSGLIQQDDRPLRHGFPREKIRQRGHRRETIRCQIPHLLALRSECHDWMPGLAKIFRQRLEHKTFTRARPATKQRDEIPAF